MHYIVYKSPTADKSRHHVTSSDVAKQQASQQQEPATRHRHQHHSAMTSLSTATDVTQQFTDVLRSRGINRSYECTSYFS